MTRRNFSPGWDFIAQAVEKNSPGCLQNWSSPSRLSLFLQKQVLNITYKTRAHAQLYTLLPQAVSQTSDIYKGEMGLDRFHDFFRANKKKANVIGW